MKLNLNLSFEINFFKGCALGVIFEEGVTFILGFAYITVSKPKKKQSFNLGQVYLA